MYAEGGSSEAEAELNSLESELALIRLVLEFELEVKTLDSENALESDKLRVSEKRSREERK